LTAENGADDGVPPEDYTGSSDDIINYLIAQGVISDTDRQLLEDIVEALTDNCTLVKYLTFCYTLLV